jgi:hypothetical protein
VTTYQYKQHGTCIWMYIMLYKVESQAHYVYHMCRCVRTTQTPRRYVHLAKVNRPYGHIAIRRREKKTNKHVRARGMKQKTKRASGVRLAVQLPSHPTPMPKPPGSILVGDALLCFFSHFRVLLCAHTKRSVNFAMCPNTAWESGLICTCSMSACVCT